MSQAAQQEAFNRSLERAASFANRDFERSQSYNARSYERTSRVLLGSMERSSALANRQNAEALNMMADSFLESADFNRRSFFAGVKQTLEANQRLRQQDADSANRMREINSRQAALNLEGFKEFSQTIGNYLDERQKAKNEQELQEGIILGLTDENGELIVDGEAMDAVQQGEDTLRSAAVAEGLENAELASVDLEAAEYDRATNPVLKGWKGYGVAQGRAMRAAANAPLFYSQYLNSEEKVLIHPETGQAVSPKQLMEGDPREIRFAVSASRAALMQHAKLEGMNPVLLTKHFLPTVLRLEPQVTEQQMKANRDKAREEAIANADSTLSYGLDLIDRDDPLAASRFVNERVDDLMATTGMSRREANEQIVGGAIRIAVGNGDRDGLALIGDSLVDPNDPKKGTWKDHPRFASQFDAAMTNLENQAEKMQAEYEASVKDQASQVIAAAQSALMADEDGSNRNAILSDYVERLEELSAAGSEEAKKELLELRADPNAYMRFDAFVELEQRFQRGDYLQPHELEVIPGLSAAQRERLNRMNPNYTVGKALKPITDLTEGLARSVILQNQARLAGENKDQQLTGGIAGAGAVGEIVLQDLTDAANNQLMDEAIAMQQQGKMMTAPQARARLGNILTELTEGNTAKQFLMEKKDGVWRRMAPGTRSEARTFRGSVVDVTGLPPTTISSAEAQNGLVLEKDEVEQFGQQVAAGQVPERIRDLAMLAGLSPAELINEQAQHFGIAPITAPEGAATESLSLQSLAERTDPGSRRGRSLRARIQQFDAYQQMQRDADAARASRLQAAGGQRGQQGGAITSFKGGVIVTQTNDPDGEQTGSDIVFPGGADNGQGAPVVSPVEGVVIKTGWQGDSSSGFGNYAVVKYTGADGGTYTAMFAHLDNLDGISEGMSIQKGQPFAVQGLTGSGTAPHVSFHINGAGNKYGDPLTGKSPQREMQRVLGLLRNGFNASSARTGTGGGNIDPQTQAVKPILDLIAGGEAGPDGYNAINRGRAGDSIGAGVQLTNMSIRQILNQQRSGKMFAVGRYQFIPETLAEAVKRAGISQNEKFTPEVQDRLGQELIMGGWKRPKLSAYLRGDSSDLAAAALEMAQEWATFATASGRSYYAGKAGNAAHVNYATLVRYLKQVRQQNLG